MSLNGQCIEVRLYANGYWWQLHSLSGSIPAMQSMPINLDRTGSRRCSIAAHCRLCLCTCNIVHCFLCHRPLPALGQPRRRRRSLYLDSLSRACTFDYFFWSDSAPAPSCASSFLPRGRMCFDILASVFSFSKLVWRHTCTSSSLRDYCSSKSVSQHLVH